MPIYLDQAAPAPRRAATAFAIGALTSGRSDRRLSIMPSPPLLPPAHPEAAMTSRPVDTSLDATPSNEHQERRVGATPGRAERRLDQYRSSIWTPSGRP